MIEASNTVDDAAPAGPYCSAGHAAALLNVSVQTVHRMIGRGELVAERYRIPIASVERLASQRRATRIETMSLTNAAVLLDRNRRTIQRYVASGALKGNGYGRVTRESVEALAASRSKADAAAVA